MDFRLSDLQRDLADATRAVLEKHCSAAVLRASRDVPVADPGGPLWSALAGLGLPAALLPGDVGGLGLTITDLLPALVETGRAGVPAPIVETALIAAPLLRDTPDAAAVASGTMSITATSAREYAPWPATAVLTLHPDRAVLSPGTGLIPVPTVDRTRPLYRAPVDGDPLDVQRGAILTTDAEALAAARLRGALGAAAQLIGLGHRMLDLTTAYVRDRHQFGQPIGSFQAVGHRLADALLRLRFAEPLVHRAGLSLDGVDCLDEFDGAGAAAPSASSVRSAHGACSVRSAHVAMAKAMAGAAAEEASLAAIQCHGAMGYTDEYDLQLYAKRAWALAASGGTTAEHRAVLAESLGLRPEEIR